MSKIRINAEKNMERLRIPYGDQMIIVKEASNELKKEILDEIIAAAESEDKEIDEKEIFNKLVNECTNIEFEGNIFEVKQLNHVGQLIVNEITLMINEIIEETYQIMKMAIQKTKQDSMESEIKIESSEIKKIVEEKEPNEEKVVKLVKKPNRGRRNVR